MSLLSLGFAKQSPVWHRVEYFGEVYAPVDTNSGIFETVIFLHESAFRTDETRNVFVV